MLKKTLIIIGLGIIVLAIALPIAVFDSSPFVVETERVDTATTKNAKQLAKQILHTLSSNHTDRSITLSHEQVSSLMALVSHTLPMVSTRTNKQDDTWLVSATLKVPKLPSLYINATSHLPPGDINLRSTMVDIGSLSVSMATLLKLGAGAINLSKKEGDNIDHDKIFRQIVLSRQGIKVDIHPEFNLERLKTSVKSSGKRALKQLASNQDDSTQINHYLNLLAKLDAMTAGIDGIRISFSEYLPPLFAEAQKRSANSNPQTENRYALLALIYFAGDYDIRRAIKNIYAPNIRQVSSASSPRLEGRHDLVLHFIYSAAIEVITTAETSIGIGEIKELSDANRGGSGYSFADLMADKAGIYFARNLSHPTIASKMQSSLQTIKQETDFFPPISGLPEQIEETEFKDRFGDTQSHAYKMLEQEIDQRIRSRKIYRLES